MRNIRFKNILIGIFLLLTVTLLTFNTVTAYDAIDTQPNPVESPVDGPSQGLGLGSGNAINENDEMNKGNQGGPTYARTGWLLTLCDDSGQSVLGSQIAFFPYNNTLPNAMAGSISTEFFENSMTTFYQGTHINTIPAFNGNAGGGSILKAWLMQPCESDPTYTSNAMMVAETYLGIPVATIEQELANGNTLYIQFSPIFWARLQGETKDSQGDWWVSNSRLWAIANPRPSYIAPATHRNFPQSCALEFPWWGLGSVSGFKGQGGYWDISEWQSNGLGIGGVSLKAGKQIVICVETDNGWNTQYLSTDRYYDVKTEINGAVLQPDSGFVSETPTKATSSSASYSEVKSGCTQIGGLVGAGTFDFLSRPKASALFLHYKGNTPVATTSTTDLEAWELTVRVPGESNIAAGSNKRTSKAIEHHSFNQMQQRVESWQSSVPFNRELRYGTEHSRSQASEHNYRLSQNHGQYNISGGIWQLYRGNYIDQWRTFQELPGTVWSVDDKIDPNYGYYIARSHLESLGIVEDRENGGTASAYLSTPNGFVLGYNGKAGKEPQGSNTTKTWFNVAPYNYSYVPSWANGKGAWIKLDEYSREILPHGDSCYGDNPDTIAVVETDYLVCTSKHYTPWKYEGVFVYNKPASYFYSLSGSYGNANINKYKVQSVTATGKSGHAGDASTDKSGVDLKGKFVKGDDFDYSDRVSKAIHGSEFPETYKLYGEIPMLFWHQNNTYEYDTQYAKTAFVWGEFERSIKPSLIHGFKTEIIGGTGGGMSGVGSLPTNATGATAQDIMSRSGATTLGVTAMGTSFNLGLTSKYKFEFNTAGFTTEDELSTGINANSAWGNQHSSVLNAHNTYVNSVLAGVQQEIIMELTFKPSGNKLYYRLLTDTAGIASQVTDKVGDYDLWWKNNSLQSSVDYSGFYDAGIAESYLNVKELFDGTLINNGESHTGQSNTSEKSSLKNVVDYSGGSYEEYTNYGNWYDEESYYRFEIEKYRTTVIMDTLGAADKIDYNVLSQDAYSKYLNQKDFIEVRFYTRLYREPNTQFTDGYYSWDGCETFRVDKIQGVDFSVINQSTADMKK